MHRSMGAFGFSDMIYWSRFATYRSDTSSCWEIKSACRAKSWLTACDRPLRVTLPGYKTNVSTEYQLTNIKFMRTGFQFPLFLRVSWANIVQVRQEWLVCHEFFEELLLAILETSWTEHRQEQRPQRGGRGHNGVCVRGCRDHGGGSGSRTRVSERARRGQRVEPGRFSPRPSSTPATSLPPSRTLSFIVFPPPRWR